MYLLLLFLLTPAVFSYDIANYTNKNLRYPKCCPSGYYLHYETENSTLTCYEYPSITFQINAKSIDNYTDYNCNEECADFLVEKDNSVKLIIPNCDSGNYAEISNFTTYPKCCPLGHLYDPQEHKCVYNESASFPEEQGVYVKYSLSQCRDGHTALIDHLIDEVQVDDGLNITFNGVKYGYGKYCFDETVEKRKLVRTCEDISVACTRSYGDDGIRCLKKCCPDGQVYVGNLCKTVPGYGIRIFNESRIKYNDDYNFGIIQVPRRRKYAATNRHKFYIDKVGIFHVSETSRWRVFSTDDAIYCLETIYTENSTKTAFFLFPIGENEITLMKFNLSAILLSLSCVFAMVTFVCYLLLPEIHNLYGKSIMMYCLVLTVGFALLAYVQFQTKGMKYCAHLGFLIQFFMLASFSWLNVICFDMWMAFGQLRVKGISSKKTNLKRFIYYNLYAWSVPTITTLFTYITYETRWLPEKFNPHLGTVKCFFDYVYGTYDHFIFFIAPLTVLIVANVVFFVKTIMYCFNVKDQINKMKTSPSNDKARRSQKLNAEMEKMVMLVKLCIIMGVSWLFEVVSSIISFEENRTAEIIEVIWDMFNSLQGVFIFCIFILKKPMLNSLKNKLFPLSSTRKASEVSTAMTSVSGKNQQNGRKTSEVRTNAA